MASWYDWFSQQQQQPQQYKSWADFTTPGYDNMQQKNFTQIGLEGQYKPAQTNMGSIIGDASADLGNKSWKNWFSADKLAGYGAAAQGIGALANSWTGYQQLQQQQDMFDFQKENTLANFYNLATLARERQQTRADNNYAFQGGASNPNLVTPEEHMNEFGVSTSHKDAANKNKNRNRNV